MFHFICIMPEILMSQYAIQILVFFFFILIVVNVILDIFQQIQSHMLTSQYGSMMQSKMLNVRK